MRVRSGNAPQLFEVESETETRKWYQVFANGTVIKCTCKPLAGGGNGQEDYSF